MDSKQAGSKGFLFTALALVLLTFMLASLSARASATASQEQTYAYRFKVESLNSLLESTNDAQLSNFAQISLQHSLSTLANYTSTTQPLLPEPTAHADNPYTQNVNLSLNELMVNGSTRGGESGFLTPLSLSQPAYSLKEWQRALNASASAAGFSLSFGEIYSFDAYQPDAWSVAVRFSLPINITDSQRAFNVSKTLHANATIPIEGIYDPLVAREDARKRFAFPSAPDALFAQKQIFHNADYSSPQSVSPTLLADEDGRDVLGGLGWFYGPALELSHDEIPTVNATMARQSILVSDYYEGIEADAAIFGALAITNRPTDAPPQVSVEGDCTTTTTQQTQCVNCIRRTVRTCAGNTVSDVSEITNKVNFTYVVTPGRDWLLHATVVPADSYPHVLIDNQYGVGAYEHAGTGFYHRIYDIEKLRDMAVCGLYVQRDLAPSFFQRMVNFPLNSPISSPLGIESFLVGKWAGGADDAQENDLRSRVDRLFFSPSAFEASGLRIKGMSGCKSRDMCSSEDAYTYGVGHFRLDQESITAYGLDAIACNATAGGGCG